VSGPSAVTVVVPVWDDYVALLPEAVESVRRNAPETPIIIVDNASATAVPQLPGCTLVRAQERLSAGGARNLGLEHVGTEYVVFLDADDMLLEGTLAFLVSRIAADLSLAVSATSILDGETGERHRSPRRFVRRLVRWRLLFALANSVWSLLPLQGCAILRTTQVRLAGGYADANWGEDWVLAASLAFRGRVELSDRLGRLYRSTPDSLWRRPRGTREFVQSAHRLRARLRFDPALPGWVRAILPVIALLQLAAIYLLRPAYLTVSRLLRRR
jgi:Glycosyl transferase family 2